MSTDPRVNNPDKLTPPFPLPHVSRRALARVPDPLPIPTTCRFCAETVELVENSVIYNGRSYGDWPYAYFCGGCHSYVGLHPDTDLPLGTLADKRTREARNTCKRTFEAIWRDKHMGRSQAYQWLADKMRISREECHFGLFEPQQCKEAEAYCMDYLDNITPARR
jgi:hypothetical protein